MRIGPQLRPTKPSNAGSVTSAEAATNATDTGTDAAIEGAVQQIRRASLLPVSDVSAPRAAGKEEKEKEERGMRKGIQSISVLVDACEVKGKQMQEMLHRWVGIDTKVGSKSNRK